MTLSTESEWKLRKTLEADSEIEIQSKKRCLRLIEKVLLRGNGTLRFKRKTTNKIGSISSGITGFRRGESYVEMKDNYMILILVEYAMCEVNLDTPFRHFSTILPHSAITMCSNSDIAIVSSKIRSL